MDVGDCVTLAGNLLEVRHRGAPWLQKEIREVTSGTMPAPKAQSSPVLEDQRPRDPGAGPGADLDNGFSTKGEGRGIGVSTRPVRS